MNFYEQITMLCHKKGISVNKMCKEIGLSNATATQWKKGATPTARTLERIAEYFGTTALELAKALATAEAMCKYRDYYAEKQARMYNNKNFEIYMKSTMKVLYAYMYAPTHIQKAINLILEVEIDVESEAFKEMVKEQKWLEQESTDEPTKD